MSDDNVIRFPPDKDAVEETPDDMSQAHWHCDCGCCSFYLQGDQRLVCAMCGQPVDPKAAGQWRQPEPPASDQVHAINEGVIPTQVIDIGSSMANLHRTANRALQSPDDTAGMIVIKNSGSVHTWGVRFETQDERDWLDRRLESARMLLVKFSDRQT